MSTLTYRDRVRCPQGHAFTIKRRVASAGRLVGTYCPMCNRVHQIKAGQPRPMKGQKP